MFGPSALLPVAALISVAHGHGVILGAQGEAGSPPSVGFQVDTALARNCTSISPCQQDTTIIRDAEITANIVNECGRTELSGNIDVGENTENALAAGAVTQVKAGTQLTVTIHQVNADGAGPYSCDLDETSNTGVISQNLSVTNNVPGVNGLSQAKTQDFNITVQMPDKFSCTGASTGNICTVRCRNNAVAGPFVCKGGCFAVQQTDIAATANTPSNIQTAQSAKAVLAQIQQNQADLPVAVAANQKDGTDEGKQNLVNVQQLLALSVTSKAAPVQTLNVLLGGTAAADTAAAATTTAAATSNNGNGRKSKGNGGNNANAAATDANGATTNTNSNGRNKGNNNNNNKRSADSALKWAKRLVGSEES
uniref:GEgh 16 protein n=1 Tax=Fungal sp. (strain NRRL 50135) TaxID=1547289 RepID=A0A089FNE1_FUNXX|nr:hypothetical protein gNR604 [fungal sp. NRRL 50135]